MSPFHLDRRRVRRNFGRAARTYEQHDALQREVQQLLLDRLGFYLQAPQRVLDVGAGTGRGSALLKERYGKAEVIAVDLAVPMLQAAKQHSRWLKPFQRVCADATALPFPDHSVDVLHSNLCFQWIDDLAALFGECARVLRPGGLLAFSTFGPDTLRELRAAWAAADRQSHVSRFLDMHDVGDAMLGAGLRDPVLDVDRFTLTYSSPAMLLKTATCRVRSLCCARAARGHAVTPPSRVMNSRRLIIPSLRRRGRAGSAVLQGRAL